MEKLRSMEVKLIAAIFLIGGVSGFFLFFIKLLSFESSFLAIAHLVVSLLFLATAYSGYLLFKEEERGIEIGRAVILLQIVNFKIYGLTYFFVTGAYVFAGIYGQELGVKFGLDTGLSIVLDEDEPHFILRINLLALIIFIYLTKLLNKIHDDQLIQEELDRIKRENSRSQIS
ncbi:MAG: hypothetical protein HOP30_13205 [Cyclobacteriaceae bacterium]|nr:hypothetical protein [Cyclobacteriaceae bacterium]